NGAMLYDSQNMNPLFQLEIGKPGSSFAFEIARKIGLPEDILANATEKIGKDHIDFDRNLRQINRDKRYWESKREKIRRVEKMLDEMAATYETELKETQKQRKEILKKTKEEAEILLSGVNKKIENTIHEIKKEQAEKEKTKQAREKLVVLKNEIIEKTTSDDSFIDKKIKKLQEREKNRNQRRPEKSKPVVSKPEPEEEPELQAGDKVRITGQNTVGDLIEINKKNAVIAFGQLITTLPADQIERVSNNEAKRIEKNRNAGKSRLISGLSEKRLTFKSEIDIRGKRAEEAISIIQEFIDEAIMFNVSQLRILHGKGNGILKEIIRNYLKTEPAIVSFKDEHVDFGGAGITVINLS
ncbi:MAG TPA: Smr/MutS family protein, partial [Draconibacterium sp.]|nr:Smr/MutS family protein [Draconibacterium sp.]